jgi:hypothetical protein
MVRSDGVNIPVTSGTLVVQSPVFQGRSAIQSNQQAAAMASDSAEVTQLLLAWRAGDAAALE